jgi:hypothetical protein
MTILARNALLMRYGLPPAVRVNEAVDEYLEGRAARPGTPGDSAGSTQARR